MLSVGVIRTFRVGTARWMRSPPLGMLTFVLGSRWDLRWQMLISDWPTSCMFLSNSSTAAKFLSLCISWVFSGEQIAWAEKHPRCSAWVWSLVLSLLSSAQPSLPGRHREAVRKLPSIPLQILMLNTLLSCLHCLVSHLSKFFCRQLLIDGIFYTNFLLV